MKDLFPAKKEKREMEERGGTSREVEPKKRVNNFLYFSVQDDCKNSKISS